MKKCFKRTAAVLLSAVMIFGVCGCSNSDTPIATTEIESTSAVSKQDNLLNNHMTEKELAAAEETEFMLLDKPWESAQASESDAAEEDYSNLKDKILYCEGFGAIVNEEPVFNPLPPAGYDGGSGTVEFMHVDQVDGSWEIEEVSFDNLEDAKTKLRAEYDEDIANGHQKVPTDIEYNNSIKLFEAVAENDYETTTQEYIEHYLDYYYGSMSNQDSESMYWEMDEEKVSAIKDYISEYHMYDEELDLNFTIHVVTPPDYDSAKAYPVLAMTDAVWRFNDVTSLYEAMKEGKADPQILITIGFAYDLDGWDNELRGSILCDRKKEFLDFITDNLMPYLNERYNFDFENSTLFGHSQGGVFTHYAAFNFDRYENKPFKNYIIGSPTFWTPYFTCVEDYEEYKNEYGYFERCDSYDRNLVITAGDEEDEDYEEYFGDNDSTLEGVDHLQERLEQAGVTTYKVKIYKSHHYQYVPNLLLEYFTNSL